LFSSPLHIPRVIDSNPTQAVPLKNDQKTIKEKLRRTGLFVLFLVMLVPLAFVWGFVTQKTDSLWGLVLFHAGWISPL
jgi:membrane protease YdiL (CAAX protease family)